MKGLSITSLILSIIFLIIGFYRLLFYSNPEEYSYRDPQNAWVGGDAYNYIINAAQATAFFVLFAAFFLAFVIIRIGLKLQNADKPASNVNFDEVENKYNNTDKW